MKKDTLHITDPAFNEYLYSVLYNAPYEVCEKLPAKYHKLIKSEKSAKRFIQNSGWDEKMMVLSYLGVNSYLVLDENSIKAPGLKKIVASFREKQLSMSLNEIIDTGLYITSNKHLTSVLKIMSQIIQGNSYKYNMEYKKTGYNLKQWSKQMGKGEYEENESLDRFVIKTLVNNNSIVKRSTDIFNLKFSELHLLSLLYIHSNDYIPIEKLWEDCNGVLASYDVTVALKNLCEKDYIDRYPISNKRKYCISSMGIKIISEYKSMVAKYNNFN